MKQPLSRFAPPCVRQRRPLFGHVQACAGRLGAAALSPSLSALRWREWDACALIAKAQEKLPILVDQGDRDDFMANQLKPEALESAAAAANHPLTLRLQAGYDHSYYFIASFIDDHLRHHALALKG